MKSPIRLTEFASGGGCGCKLSPALLRDLLRQANIMDNPPPLLVGAQTADDAAVWRLSDEYAIIATTDFFSPVVDDAYDFGRIAAANAISDVYAMGGTPLLALALAAMPKDLLPPATIAAIFAGGRDQAQQAGVVIAGGHSIDAKEPLYGLAVIGSARPERIVTNTTARAGDVLLLGKPLGIGVLSAALRRRRLTAAEYQLMLEQTTQLNRAGSELGQLNGIHAMTDVTGFGLLGHLAEFCRAAALGARIDFNALPLLPPALRYAQAGIATGAAARNWQSVADVMDTVELTGWQRNLLTDPQTSGGLLVACDSETVAAAQAAFRQYGQTAAIIGTMTNSKKIAINPAC